MYINKIVFTVLCAIILFFITGCIIEALRKQVKFAKSLLILLVTTFFIVVVYLLILYSKKSIVALALFGIYFALLDYQMYAILNFEHDMLLKRRVSSKYTGFLHAFQVLVLIDISLFLFGNLPGQTFYSVFPLYYGDKISCWKIDYHHFFYVHILINFTLAVLVLNRILIDIKNTKKIFQPKFIMLEVLFFLQMLFNILFVILSNYIPSVGIDNSVLLTGFLSIIAFSFTLYSENKNLLRKMMANSSDLISDAVICFDNQKQVIFINKLGKLIYEENDKEWLDKYFLKKDDNVFSNEELREYGELRYFTSEFHKIRDEKNRYSGAFIKLDDRTEIVRNMQKEEYRAKHDELTGLYNRNFFFAEMERILTESPQVPRYLVCSNIKNFKLVNNLFGTRTGDLILRKQAQMYSFARYEDCIKGRISGDKFAMLIRKEHFNPQTAINNTNRVCEILENTNYKIQIRLGIYEIANPFENVHTMYDKANLAIKNAVDDYNSTLVFYDTSLMQKMMAEKNVISEFKYALSSKQFIMFLQPQINSKNGKCLGAEALVRWYEMDKGYRQPSDFIPILEKSGLIYELDYYIWEAAAKQIKHWEEMGLDDFYISVNISPKDFYYADIYEVFTQLVQKYRISPKKLNLEITESFVFDNDRIHKQVFTELKNYGFNIEMDDFGSGYSSLNAVKELDVDVIKIDMNFLRKSENQERGRLIISAIVQMAKKLNKTVITEGVETQEQADFLKEIGVDKFQGFLYSKPMPVSDFEEKFMGVK
ncbi:MAG: EAL domain-containing protein [Treponema sp.]|nr:EAL domain-containing protein [Treponema sp.]